MVDKNLIDNCVRRVEPTVVYTPLPSKEAGAPRNGGGRVSSDGGADGAPLSESSDSSSLERGEGRASDRAADRAAAPFLRAENEDDDGYDPYSDRREAPPLFERDPWS